MGVTRSMKLSPRLVEVVHQIPNNGRTCSIRRALNVTEISNKTANFKQKHQISNIDIYIYIHK